MGRADRRGAAGRAGRLDRAAAAAARAPGTGVGGGWAAVRAVGRQGPGGRRLGPAGRLGRGAWRDLFGEPAAIGDRLSEPAAVALLLLARHAADDARSREHPPAVPYH